jgi:hypothetical protein
MTEIIFFAFLCAARRGVVGLSNTHNSSQPDKKDILGARFVRLAAQRKAKKYYFRHLSHNSTLLQEGRFDGDYINDLEQATTLVTRLEEIERRTTENIALKFHNSSVGIFRNEADRLGRCAALLRRWP